MCTAPIAPTLSLPALPQQLLARQGEESWGRNGPQAALHTSLVYSTGNFCSTGGAGSWPSPDCSGLAEAGSDIYFLGHVLAVSQEPCLN